MSDPFSSGGDHLRLAVRLTPRARTSEIAGVVYAADGRTALAIRVAAPPVGGAANEALITFLSKALRIPKSGTEIVAGQTARLKIVCLDGDPEKLASVIRALL